ncbi:uncharacterized protein LOC110943841 [Helianthus annuus]|uniref:uncharacterized protein LOC110943841 n=1 Tax=Helianthus annuus TaxID=4232 RepID=UPI000B8F12E3|nr:uncharacterized protein LOC110943841 [Helianthus annuus]
MDMYGRAESSVRAPIRDTNFFLVKVGLHQRSALSVFLFAVVLDELFKSIRETVTWCMLFADDIVLVAEDKQSLNVKAEKWVSNMTRTDDKEPTRTEDVPVTRKLFVSVYRSRSFVLLVYFSD